MDIEIPNLKKKRRMQENLKMTTDFELVKESKRYSWRLKKQ